MEIEKLIAVIVLYKSSLDDSLSFTTLLAALNKETDSLKLVVYNNSPEFWKYENIQYRNIEVIYLEDAENSGVPKAYNIAKKIGAGFFRTHLLLLDQDTQLPINFFDAFLKSEKLYQDANIGLFAPFISNDEKQLSPSKFYLNTSKPIKIDAGINPLAGLAIINSGLIISLKLFEKVNGYNEKIKLDFSDFDFLRRCLEYCESIVMFDANCKHFLSSEEIVPLKNALVRFKFYLEGAKHMHNSFTGKVTLNGWSFLRSVKLGLKYNTLSFTRLYFSKS